MEVYFMLSFELYVVELWQSYLLQGQCSSKLTPKYFSVPERNTRNHYYILYKITVYIHSTHCCYSVTKSCPVFCDPMDCSMPSSSVHHCPPVCSKSRPLSWWCHPTISSSVVPFFCLWSFPALGSFPMSWPFASGGQNIGALASASVLPMNIQGWFTSELTGWISLQSKGLLRVFYNTTAQKQQFFHTQLSLWSNSPIHTGKSIALIIWTFISKMMSLLFNMG